MVSVVTPSFRQLDWLKLCAASVADQTGVEAEHIVQDAGSGSDVEAWARTQPLLQLFVEADEGMYDAINRGLHRATGQICAYLNCDEQYLPGALSSVVKFFERHPNVDVLFGDVVLIDRNGNPISYRRTVLPTLRHTRLSHLNTATCATFFRRSLLDRGFYFDPQWKAIGDVAWMDRLLSRKVTMAVLPKPLAVFTFTGRNLGASAVSRSEEEGWKKALPDGTERSRVLAVVAHRLRKLFAGAYWPRTVKIDIYTLESLASRQHFARKGVGFGWPDANANAGTS